MAAARPTARSNDDPPRGYDGNGSQIWGHVVEPIVIDPSVIVGDGTCDTSLQNVQCKPDPRPLTDAQEHDEQGSPR